MQLWRRIGIPLLALAAVAFPLRLSAETLTCIESDGGNVSGKAGFARLKSEAGETLVTKADACKGDVLTEYYCAGSTTGEATITCPHGCSSGACLPTSTLSPPSAAAQEKRKARAGRLAERQRFFKRSTPSAKQMFYTFPGVRRKLPLPER